MRATSSNRSQPPFFPVRREPWPIRLFTAFERVIKSRLFDCRMCGNCILLETGFICPMTCPKGLRNGPCRGSTAGVCSVDPASTCTWVQISERVEKQGSLDCLLEVNAPLDNQACGVCETLLSAYRLWRKRNQGPHLRDLVVNRSQFNSDWEAFRYELRQPDWWQGDNRYHSPVTVEPASKLEAKLRNGQFAVSAEVAPPMDPTGDRIARVAGYLKEYVDTANFTDNPLSVPRDEWPGLCGPLP